MADKKGKLIIFSAPSGSGKTSIINYLLERFDNLEFSVSATNRQPRENEVHGENYYFLTTNNFRNKINNNEFVEWEEVYKDRFYGTLKSEIDKKIYSGNNIVFDVDVIGGINIKKLYKQQALSIFVKPPSIEILEQRLKNRQTDDEEDISIRLEKAKWELNYSKEFDKILINDDLETTREKSYQIINEFLS